ncbi:MAG: UvrD-helicase domain-containing protein [Planctomycetota bacterium]
MNTQMIDDSTAVNDFFRDGRLPPLLVRASAGTGKTYRLTARLLQILFQGAAPETILATTFTRKAAGEILDRVLIALAEAADPDQPDALERLREQVGIPTLPASACVQLLKKIVSNIHRLRICTLDSFFTQLARSFPFELRLPPAWRLTDEIEERWLRERAVNSVIAMLEPPELATLMSMLSKGETKRSVARELIGVVTRVYSAGRQTDRSVWETIEAPTQPEDRILTQAAADFRLAEPKQKTLLKKFGELADLTESRAFKTASAEKLLVNYAKSKRMGTPLKFGNSKVAPEMDEPIGALYAAVRSKLLSLLAAQNRATGSILEYYKREIDDLKQSLRTISFGDVAVRLANHISNLDHETFERRMDGAIDHLLLDEFQDTSVIQWQVLRPFAMRSADQATIEDDITSAIKRSFFCVGDTKQAIYGWRGGVAEIFDAVDKEIPEVTAAEQNKSFRSSPVIIETVNEVFQNLGKVDIVEVKSDAPPYDRSVIEDQTLRAFSARFPEHESERTELPGYVRLETTAKVDGRGREDEKSLLCFRLAADRIAELYRQAPDQSIGVLTRTNKAVAQLIFLLEELGVDVSQEGGNPLIDSAPVELVLSVLMRSEHPGDGRWQFHIEHSPLGKVEGLDAGFVREHLTEWGIARTVKHVADHLAPFCDERDTLRLKQLVQLAIGYEPNATQRIRDFVRMVRDKRVERARAASVRVMTIHQAKGLEFDAVFLPEIGGKVVERGSACVSDVRRLGDLPVGITRYVSTEAWHFLDTDWQDAFGREAASKITENLCLLYVAMTRARQALYMVAHPPSKKSARASRIICETLPCKTTFDESESLIIERGDPNWYAGS